MNYKNLEIKGPVFKNCPPEMIRRVMAKVKADRKRERELKREMDRQLLRGVICLNEKARTS